MAQAVAIAGSVSVDHIKEVEVFPREGMLSPIQRESISAGGCVSNTAVSLKRLDSELCVHAVGCIGPDEQGEFLRSYYRDNGLVVDGLSVMPDIATGHTDVMFARRTETRTFFNYAGANDAFGLEEVHLERLDAQILHIGYLLLLNRMDAPDPEYGTVMARTLMEARKRGIKTSIDVVSEDGDRFRHIVPAALAHCSYAVLNEIEAGSAVGIPARSESGTLLKEALPEICAALIDCGVSECVVVHCPEAGIYMNAEKKWLVLPSLRLPAGYIQGNVGAGDAFCAGVLHGLARELAPREILAVANCAAAGCLSKPDATSGVGTAEQMLLLQKQYGWQGDAWGPLA